MSGFDSGPRSTEADKQLQDGSDTRNQRRVERGSP
jgi:hypothetical protein